MNCVLAGAPAGYTETYKPPVEGGHQYSNSFNEGKVASFYIGKITS